jgi:conjugal transfer pilus assembly protein TraU
MKYTLFAFLLWGFASIAFAGCVGKMINPITDVCWSCLLPLSIGPVHVNSSGLADTPNPSGPLCACPRPPSPVPIPGIPIGFWEPVRLIDVTRTPYCMVSLGGIKLGDSRVQGTHGLTTDAKAGQESSFYHVHWYVYPLFTGSNF